MNGVHSTDDGATTKALREGRHEGVGAVIRALATCMQPHALEVSRWLCSREGEAAIERELERADEERLLSPKR